MLNIRKGEERPRLRPEMNNADRVIELIAIISAMMLIIIPVLNFKALPQTIPVHFDGAGRADGFGNRVMIWLLPAFGTVLYLVMTIASRYPHIFNFPVKITLENAKYQYTLAVRLLLVLKTAILLLFTFICYQMVSAAKGETEGLGVLFLPLFLTATFATVIIYFVLSLRNR